MSRLMLFLNTGHADHLILCRLLAPVIDSDIKYIARFRYKNVLLCAVDFLLFFVCRLPGMCGL